MNKKGITPRGNVGRRLWDAWAQLLLLQSGRVELDRLVTHRLPLEDAEAAVDPLTGDAGKILLVPARAAVVPTLAGRKPTRPPRPQLP